MGAIRSDRRKELEGQAFDQRIEGILEAPQSATGPVTPFEDMYGEVAVPMSLDAQRLEAVRTQLDALRNGKRGV